MDTVLLAAREKLNNVTILSPGELEKNCDDLITDVCSKLKESGINVTKKDLANAGLVGNAFGHHTVNA